MFARSFSLPAASLAAIVAALPAAPATAQMSLADYAVQRCEDEVVASLDRSVRFHDVAFDREPEIDRLSRSDVDVRGAGFYEPVYGRAPRVGFTYSCRFDDRRDRATAQVFPGFEVERPARPGRGGDWRARVDTPMPPVEETPAPALPPIVESVPAAPPPEPIAPAVDDAAAADAGVAAAESVGDETLGGDIVAAIGESKGSREQDEPTDQGLKPYQAEEGVTCYPAQRACYGPDGYDAGLSDREFGPQDEAPPTGGEEVLPQEEAGQ